MLKGDARFIEDMSERQGHLLQLWEYPIPNVLGQYM
jgi:hypothetical protein